MPEETHKAKIIEAKFDKKNKNVNWIVEIPDGTKYPMSWTLYELGPAFGINGKISPKIASEFCKSMIGKDFNLIIKFKDEEDQIADQIKKMNEKFKMMKKAEQTLIFGSNECKKCGALKSQLEAKGLLFKFVDANDGANEEIADKYNVDIIPHVVILDDEGSVTRTLIGDDAFDIINILQG